MHAAAVSAGAAAATGTVSGSAGSAVSAFSRASGLGTDQVVLAMQALAALALAVIGYSVFACVTGRSGGDTPSRRALKRGATIVSAVDDDDEEEKEDEEEAERSRASKAKKKSSSTRDESGGSTALALVRKPGSRSSNGGGGGGSRSIVKSKSGGGSGGGSVKAYIEVRGDVHTLRVAAGKLSGLDDLQEALLLACAQSGAPELKDIDIDSAEIQYLTDAGSGAVPSLVTEATSAASLRKARAFRVVFPSE